MTIAKLTASGDGYEIGLALGRAGARAYHEVVVNLARFRALARDWAGSERAAALHAAASQAYPEYLREIEGIADGMQADRDEVFLWNCRGDFPGGGDQAHEDTPGCTSVMIPADGARNAVIGHNEDDQAELDGRCFLVEARPRRGPGFVSFYSPGLLPGHTFGVNEAGLVQTINHIRPRNQVPGIPRHLIARAVLGSVDLDSALAVLARSDRASGFHHNLGQAGSRALFGVEAPAGVCVVHPVTRPVAHANHIVFGECADIDQEIAPSSASRQRRAEQLIAAGALDGRDPLVMLGDDADADLPICRKRRSGPDPGYTLASVVFELSREEVSWRVHAHPRERPEHQGDERLAREPVIE
ncbi:MAG: C45 family peptidase [Gammaproteobacteria bacterium]|nr:C45 family peptidase [Gammaproteobacteria bacterium]